MTYFIFSFLVENGVIYHHTEQSSDYDNNDNSDEN